MDAQFVLVPERLVIHERQTSAPRTLHTAVKLHISAGLAGQLASQAKFELGDSGDPANNWVFGPAAEVYEYKFAGSFACPSGVAGVLTPESWNAWKQDPKKESENWGKFKRQLEKGLEFPSPLYPFLWAGPVIEAATASIFASADGSRVLLSSGVEEADTP